MMNTSTLLKHVALVSDTKALDFPEVARVSAALQRQVLGHFGPTWDINATVDAFAQLEDVPIDYWPIIIRDDIDVPGAEGIHTEENGQPFALVHYSPAWSLTASHELLEMLCDPTGNLVKAGPSPMPGQGRVNFLVEVCDPSESFEFGYPINGVTVSDFYTPSYFDSVTAPGVRYSWTGAITKPRQVLQGGYISWQDPISGHWFQEVFFGSAPQFRDLGRLSASQKSIRNEIQKRTPEARTRRRAIADEALTATVRESVTSSSAAKAQAIRQKISAIQKSSARNGGK
jgi:hypothetical protein